MSLELISNARTKCDTLHLNELTFNSETYFKNYPHRLVKH